METPLSREPRPDPVNLTANPNPINNSSSGVDYEPHVSSSIPIPPSRQNVLDHITRLYSGSANEEDMRVYTENAIYDDPWSYCDTRYKIAGQWYGIPMVMSSSKTLATEVVKNDSRELIFKLKQEYHPKLMPVGKVVNSLVSLALDEDGKVVYHKDMWNEKDYSHEGLGKAMKTLNGDHLTKVTRPPHTL